MSESSWSVPESEVVQRIHERLDAGGSDILATIVDVEGIAYRRPGAKILLEDSGIGVGSITAGCLEGELLSTAGAVRDAERSELLTYDLMDPDDEAVEGWPAEVLPGIAADFAGRGRSGVVLEENDLSSLYTPVGLDLGGGTRYQIAHSIVAEVLAVKNDRKSVHLRNRDGHIHERVDAP